MNTRIFIAALQEAGLEPYAYIGRGMQGRECVAITVTGSATDVILDLIAAFVEDAHYSTTLYERVVALCKAARRSSIDSMGRDQVVYWTAHTWIDISEHGEHDATRSAE